MADKERSADAPGKFRCYKCGHRTNSNIELKSHLERHGEKAARADRAASRRKTRRLKMGW